MSLHYTYKSETNKEESKVYYTFAMSFNDKNSENNDKGVVHYVYPYMLVFQIAIVLLISILGQLIITEKTVTEAL